MTEEMTRAGLEAEARRRYQEAVDRGRRSNERWLVAIYALVIIGGVALLLIVAHIKREARDAHAALEHAHYELMAVTGGAR